MNNEFVEKFTMFRYFVLVLLSITVYFDIASIFHTPGFVDPIITPQIIPHPKIQQLFYGSGKEYEIAEWMKKKEQSYLETNERIKEVCERHNKSNSNKISLGQLMMDTYYATCIAMACSWVNCKS